MQWLVTSSLLIALAVPIVSRGLPEFPNSSRDQNAPFNTRLKFSALTLALVLTRLTTRELFSSRHMPPRKKARMKTPRKRLSNADAVAGPSYDAQAPEKYLDQAAGSAVVNVKDKLSNLPLDVLFEVHTYISTI